MKRRTPAAVPRWVLNHIRSKRAKFAIEQGKRRGLRVRRRRKEEEEGRRGRRKREEEDEGIKWRSTLEERHFMKFSRFPSLLRRAFDLSLPFTGARGALPSLTPPER